MRSPASRDVAPPLSVSTSTVASTTAPPADPSATTGDTSGRAMAWDSVTVGRSSIDLFTWGCPGAVGVTAVLSAHVVVTAFARPTDGVSRGEPSCPPHRTSIHLDLPAEIGGRPVVDGSYDASATHAVAWSKRKAAEMMISLRFPDPTCAHVARVATVESAASVTMTAFVLPDPGTGCQDRTDPFRDYDVTLAAPLGARTLVDGRCAYVDPCR
jgi:hypothetical protein